MVRPSHDGLGIRIQHRTPRKRRERIKTPTKETTLHRESPDTQTEADSLHRPTMQSPKRTKKIKVERDPSSFREQTRSLAKIK
jgi:hypothetical protein